jgi:hypothetical protein
MFIRHIEVFYILTGVPPGVTPGPLFVLLQRHVCSLECRKFEGLNLIPSSTCD